ncbi:MAG: hypothetical protein KGQ93_00370 [Cyanobacteria bacterium REEB459]|nr:hypothetical protein [Cyanobacteria bacterium REEB459]
MTFTIAESIVKFSTSPLQLASGFHRPLARLGILLSCLGLLATGVGVQASHGPNYQAQSTLTAPQPRLVTPSGAVFPAPGRYLFGQAPQANQLGQGYMVVESTGDRLYGALYFPSSSFDCFQGQIRGNQLALTITDSYNQQTYPYSVAVATDTTVAASQLPNGLTPLSLRGFYPIRQLSSTDITMLETCRPR